MISFDKIVDTVKTEKFIEIGFSLDEVKKKPVFTSLENKNNKRFRCMLDSGESIPVWCAGVESLMLTFPKAEQKQDIKYVLSGFGRGYDVAEVCYIPAMVLDNGEHSIVFNRMYLPVISKNRFGADLIMPSSFFKNANIILSQMQTLPEKQLIFQCHNPWYITKFTKVRVSAKAAEDLRKIYGIDVSAENDILGNDGEFNDVLAQIGSSPEVIEDFSEDDQGQDTGIASLDVFGGSGKGDT